MASSVSVSVSAGSAPASGSAMRLAGLGNRLLEVYARRLPRAEFAAQIACLLAEALRVKAVAVLTYDTHTDRLRLLADTGLPADARAALGSGADCPWDLPLRGLHNRRISVIAAAQENPFVPRALVKISLRALTASYTAVSRERDGLRRPWPTPKRRRLRRSPTCVGKWTRSSSASWRWIPSACVRSRLAETRQEESARALVALHVERAGLVDSQLSTVTAERQRLATQVTEVATRARTAEEAVARLEGRVALERAAMEADRQQWEAQLSRARADLDAAGLRNHELDEARTAAVAAVDALRAQVGEEQAARRRYVSGPRERRLYGYAGAGE